MTGGICERTQQVRDALVAKVQENRAAATDCSLVTTDDLAGITDNLGLGNQGIEALKPGDFADLGNMTDLYLGGNALSALPAGIFDGLGALINLYLLNNNLPAGSLPDRVFEPLTGMNTLDLRHNPGFASFLPLADAGADLVLDAGETATLGGPGVGLWGTNAGHRWVEVDADGNEVMSADRAEGLAATDVARPVFTAPALAEERVLHYRLRVQGRGWSFRPSGGYDVFDTVTVTVRAAPAVTSVALTSAPRADATYREGERIEVSVTFAAPVTVTGKPRIGSRWARIRWRCPMRAMPARRCWCSATRCHRGPWTRTAWRCPRTPSCSGTQPSPVSTAGRQCSTTLRWRRTRLTRSTARRRR